MDPLPLTDFAGLNFNEACLVTLALVALVLVGLIVMDGLGHLWMRLTGRDK